MNHNTIIFTIPGYEQMGDDIATRLDVPKGELVIRHFPDGETYVRVLSDVGQKQAIVLWSLHEPDNRTLPLYFLCRLLKDLQARSVTVVIPYLAYMRQDKVFLPGEAVTSRYFAEIFSGCIDHLITIDPHLHRIRTLQEVYNMPATVLHAAEPAAIWIKEHIPDAVLIGPDSESRQWVEHIAALSGLPFTVLEKTRHGDEKVQVSVPDLSKYHSCTPVLIDDIISTAHTMIETVGHLKKAGAPPPVCVGVHAVFAGNSYRDLQNAGVAKIITCNTIMHQSNAIDLAPIITACLRDIPGL